MFKSALTLAAAVLLFTACGGENQESIQEHEEHAVHDEKPAHEVGMQMDEMGHADEYPIAGMDREAHEAAITPVKDVPTLEASAEVQASLKSATQTYLALKNALVEERIEEAKKAGETLAKEMTSMAAMDMSDEVKSFVGSRADNVRTEAEEIANAETVGAQRGYFATLSKNMFELNKAIDTGEESLYFQYCPMAFDNKGGYWLSSEQEILNPYFGEAMLKCGRVAETL